MALQETYLLLCYPESFSAPQRTILEVRQVTSNRLLQVCTATDTFLQMTARCLIDQFSVLYVEDQRADKQQRKILDTIDFL
jgi:hypothetical protein